MSGGIRPLNTHVPVVRGTVGKLAGGGGRDVATEPRVENSREWRGAEILLGCSQLIAALLLRFSFVAVIR